MNANESTRSKFRLPQMTMKEQARIAHLDIDKELDKFFDRRKHKHPMRRRTDGMQPR